MNISSFFQCSSSERIGFIILFFLILSTSFVKLCDFESINFFDYPLLPAKILKKQPRIFSNVNVFPTKILEKETYKFFPFDPNTLDTEGFQKMGLSKKQITIICNYRAKGGRFQKAEDFARIYSISHELYLNIAAFINIDTTLFAQKRQIISFIKKPKITARINLNSANEESLKTLPLIGEKRAQQIILYRNKIGGFYSCSQLLEIWGFTQEIVETITPFLTIDSNTIKRLDINEATILEFKAHPYFGYFTAKKIIEYRKIQGVIIDPKELLNNKILDSSIYNKIRPYITIEKKKM